MKTIILKASWIIKASREEIYRIMSDFENMPKYFPAVAESIRVIKREGNHLIMEIKAKTFGRTISAQMDTQLHPPLGYVSDNKSGIGTSGHEEFLMEEITGGTKINYTYNIELKSFILRIFAKPLIGWYAMRFWKHAVIDKLKEMLEK
ncbi:MAG: SRPBCC family protein [Patescibacteria group bacterium]|nr:SRPBCC family protein [Patescibacteria group bacterium]MDD5121510.1 SRPBCC family protein [Patescibacteria group bacterium]MDD5222048.1 SRPBCC family protein [Patescibacteria group bacterium]MDD5396328.1 SRPBCC family protein [Patescibacteria group bacterium]